MVLNITNIFEWCERFEITSFVCKKVGKIECLIFLEIKKRRISSDPGSRASVNVETSSGNPLKNKDDDGEVRFKRIQDQIPLNISDSKYCRKHNYASVRGIVQTSKFITAHHF